MNNDIKQIQNFDCDGPLKNFTYEKLNDQLFEFITKNSVISVIDLELNYVDKIVFDMYLSLIRSSNHIQKFVEFLKENSVDVSINMFLEVIYLTLKNKELKFEEIIKSMSYRLLFNKLKLSVYLFFNHFLNLDYYIKSTNPENIEKIFLVNASLIVTEKFNRFDIETQKDIFKYNIPVIEFESIRSIKSNVIDAEVLRYKVDKSLKAKKDIFFGQLKHSFYRNYISTLDLNVCVVDLKELFENNNDAFFEEHLKGIKNNINNNKNVQYKIIIPKLDAQKTEVMIHFLNDIEPSILLNIYFRGIKTIQEFFEVKESISDYLKQTQQISTSNIVIDTDELSYHINQIKKAHQIHDIIIDCDAIIEDIYEYNPHVEITMKQFKKNYLYVFKEIHAHLKYIKVSHSIYSSQLKNKEIYKMYQSSGFKNFVTYFDIVTSDNGEN